MRIKKIVIIFALIIFCFAGKANASGFYIGSQDAAAGGMGNAFTAVADNASATWYNPAGTVFLQGNNHYGLGTNFAMAGMKHGKEGKKEDEIKSEVNLIPAAYAVRKLNDKMALSLGINAPFGFTNKWSKDSQTSRVALESTVKDINFNLNFAYKLSESFSAALGFNYAYMTAKLTSLGVDIDADKSEDGYGYNIALMYKPNKAWSFGAAYRSRIKATLYGGNFIVSNPLPAPHFKLPVEADLTVPDLLWIGTSFWANENLLLSLQLDYTNWATYDKLNFKNRDKGYLIKSQYKGFGPAYALRLGIKYIANNKWTLRGGLVYDDNPVKASLLETRVPDSDRTEIALGATYSLSNSFTLDLSYTRVQFLKRTVKGSKVDPSLTGTYHSYVDMPALSIGYKF